MKNTERYNTAGMSEGEFESGTNDLILKNLQGISDLQQIENWESENLARISRELVDHFSPHHQFSANDIRAIHKNWLGDLYSWAGNYRQVNMSKGGFTFAAAHLLPKLMSDFEKNELAKYTPCNFQEPQALIAALAIVHTELVLIHPFREGNGRLARFVSVLMALQAGLQVFDFSAIKEGDLQEEYFAAVRAGLDKNYRPMEIIFEKLISSSSSQ